MVVLNPLFNRFRTVNRMTINNEKYLAFTMANQTSEKLLEHFSSKPLLEYHKVKLSLIRDGGNHITTKALTSSRNHWLLTTAPIGTPNRMIRSHSHLIAPVNSGLFTFGLLVDSGVFFLKPVPYLLRVFLKGPAKWFLRCKSPTRKISPHCPDRKPDTKPLFNQLSHTLSCPKIKWKLQLFRMTINNRLGNLRRLPGKKRPSFRTTSSLGFKCLITSFSVFLYPLADSLARNTKYFCNFDLLLAIGLGSDQAILLIFKGYRSENRYFEALKSHFWRQNCPVRNSRFTRFVASFSCPAA